MGPPNQPIDQRQLRPRENLSESLHLNRSERKDRVLYCPAQFVLSYSSPPGPVPGTSSLYSLPAPTALQLLYLDLQETHRWISRTTAPPIPPATIANVTVAARSQARRAAIRAIRSAGCARSAVA